MEHMLDAQRGNPRCIGQERERTIGGDRPLRQADVLLDRASACEPLPPTVFLYDVATALVYQGFPAGTGFGTLKDYLINIGDARPH